MVIHCGLRREERAFEFVYADRFTLNTWQILEVEQMDADVTIDLLLRKLSFLDERNGLGLTSSQFILVTRIESEVFEHQLLPVLFIEHLDELLFVLLCDDIALNLLCRNWRLLRVFLQLGLELRLGDFAVLIGVEHGQDDAPELLIGVYVDDLKHLKHLRV